MTRMPRITAPMVIAAPPVRRRMANLMATIVCCEGVKIGGSRWPSAREDDGDELEEHGEKAAAHATRTIVVPPPRCN